MVFYGQDAYKAQVIASEGLRRTGPTSQESESARMKTDAVFKRAFNDTVELVAELGDGEPLPSEYALRAKLGVSRTTVRKIISTLSARGIVTGSGRERIVRSQSELDVWLEALSLTLFPPNSPPRRLRHGIERRLALRPGDEIFRDAFGHRAPGFHRRRADMGQEHRVVERQQFRRDIGLVLEDVEAGG